MILPIRFDKHMDQSIKAGILGAIVAIFANFIIIPPPFDFIPTFVVAIFAIFVFRLATLRDGLVAAFMTYLFSQAILSTLTLADYYASNTIYTLTVTADLIPDPIITAISALIAAYIGVWLVTKGRPPPPKAPAPPQSTDIPPELQTV